MPFVFQAFNGNRVEHDGHNGDTKGTGYERELLTRRVAGITTQEVPTSHPGHRPVSRRDLAEVGVLGIAVLALTTAATWLGGRLAVPVGWRLAVGACVAIFVAGSARLAYYGVRPSWRWWGALVALWVLIVLANALADVRLW